MGRPHLQLADGRWCLWRLADDEFVTLGHHALPLQQNYGLLLRLHQRLLRSGTPLTLAHSLVVLELRFGPSSPLFDAHHGSFSFPLLLTTERRRRVSLLLRCHDHRGTLYFPLYHIVTGDPSLHDRARHHVPREGDLSLADVNEFTMLFHSYLLVQAALRETGLAASFYRAIPSDLTVYGHDSGTFFERRYGCWDDYQRAHQELEARLGHQRTRGNSDRVERLIDEVTRS